MRFLVGSTDFSDNVIIGTYEVNRVPVYDEWEDAGRKIHRIKARDKVKGSFELFFRTLSEYQTFKTAINNNTSSTNLSVTVTATVNNTNTNVPDMDVYLDFSLVRDVDGTGNDMLQKIKVNIEER